MTDDRVRYEDLELRPPELRAGIPRRRITPEYVQYLRDIGASQELIDFAARNVSQRSKPRPSRAVIGWLLVSLAVVLLSALAAWLLWQGFTEGGSDADSRAGFARPRDGQSGGREHPRTAGVHQGAGVPSRRGVGPAYAGLQVGAVEGLRLRPARVPRGPALGRTGEEVTRLPDTATAVTGVASWYCGGGSACTKGYPPGTLAAAAGPALRVGDWRGRIVRVCAGERCVRVALVDWCACRGRIVDLYRAAFSRLASPSRGIVRVTVTWGGSASGGLPQTSTED